MIIIDFNSSKNPWEMSSTERPYNKKRSVASWTRLVTLEWFPGPLRIRQ